MRLFKWKIFGVIPAPLLGLLVIFSILTPLIINTRDAQAAASTISQETDGLNIFRAIKYYHAFESCSTASSFKKEIRGDDVTKGPRYWTKDNSTITIGIAIDQWNDKNGVTTCAGDGDNQVWMADAYKLFGVDPDGGESSLKKLGYSCSIESGTTVCKKDDINNTIVDYIKKSPYLKGSSIGDTSSTLYKIGSYAGAFKTFQTACAGKSGGNTNIVNVSIIQKNGSVKKENWTQNGSSPHSGLSPINSMKSNTDSCDNTIVSVMNDNADAYGVWVNESTCKANYPELANEISRLTWCARGRANATNPIYCITEPTNVVTRNACFTGAGHPVDEAGKTAGELCMAMRFANNQETAACINGAINNGNASYCASTYPAPDSLSVSGSPPNDTNKAKREACALGAALKVSGGGEIESVNTGITEDDGDPDSTTCVVDSVGWIVCPIVGFASTMSDVLYGWISSYLVVQPLNVDVNSDNNTMYVAWNIMRNIANVAFVIAFILIIYSQLTGTGVSNYGVKKALPRLVIAAILVNLSYWIAAAAVDISNIVGNNLYNILKNLPLGNVAGESLGWEAISAWLLAGGTATGLIIAGAAVTSAGAWGTVGVAALYVLIPIVIAVVLALVVAFVVLALRQALIIVMIVISPLAFVAMLLPNTEKFFKMWQKSLLTLLVFYPLFSLLFGGAYVAGMIIIGSAGQGEASAVAMTVIIGMAITTLPLFLTPMLLKISSGIMGQVGNTLNGKFKNNPLSRALKGVRNRKAGLAMGETFGRAGSKNPFNRAYRAVQNNRQADAERKGIIEKDNKAAYLETNRAGRLNSQSEELGDRIKTAEAEHKEAYEKSVLDTPRLMKYRQKQDASKRATADYSARQEQHIEGNLSAASEAHDQSRENATFLTNGLKEEQKLRIAQAQEADPLIKNERLKQAATTKDINQIEKDRQRVVAQAGNVAGAARLAEEGYDPSVMSRIQAANNATADTELHIAHEDAQSTAETVVRQGADAGLTGVKLATEAAKGVQAGEAKQFEAKVAAAKTAVGGASLVSQGLATDATVSRLQAVQASLADTELDIARSTSQSTLETAQRQEASQDLQGTKLATEASQREKKVLDDQFSQLVTEATSTVGGQQLVDEGYDAAVIDSLQSSKVDSSVTAAATAAAERVEREEFTDLLQNDAVIAQAAGGIEGDRGATRAVASAINAEVSAETDNIRAASTVLKNAQLDQDQTRRVAMGEPITTASGRTFNGADMETRAAAIQATVAANDVEAMNALWNQSASWPGEEGNKLRTILADSLQASSGRPVYYSQGAIAQLRTGEHSNPQGATRTAVENAVMSNAYSPQKIAAADKEELNVIAQFTAEQMALPQSQRKVSDEQLQLILSNAAQALTDPRISPTIGKNLEQIQNMANYRAPSSTIDYESNTTTKP